MPAHPAIPETVDELLQHMVRTDSVNAAISGREDAEGELGAFLEACGRGWGLAVQRLAVPSRADNLLFTYTVDPSAPWLVFDSHMDTVSTEGMTIDSFGGVIADGRLYGRGACDTKGTGAAMLWALRSLVHDRELKPAHNIALLFSVDEEIAMAGIHAFIEQHLPALGWQVRGVIVGEPTWLRMLTAHNGVLRRKVITRGDAAHSAVPEMGRNAISAMVQVIAAIEQHYIGRIDATHPLTGGAAASINTIHGGTQANIIAARCEIELDRRLVPGEDPAADDRMFETALDEARRQDSHLEVEAHRTRLGPSLPDEASAPLVPLVSGVLSAHQLPTAPFGAPFCTHAGPLAAAGLPAIVIGPGDPMPAHTPEEWVELDAIRRGVEVYRNLMLAPLDTNQGG